MTAFEKPKKKKDWSKLRSPNDPKGRYSNNPKVSHVFRIINRVNGKAYYGLETNRNVMWCSPTTTYSKSHLDYISEIRNCPALKHDLDTMGKHVFVVENLFVSPDREMARKFLHNIRMTKGFFESPWIYNTPDLLKNRSSQYISEHRKEFMKRCHYSFVQDQYGVIRASFVFDEDELDQVIQIKIFETQQEVAERWNRPEVGALVSIKQKAAAIKRHAQRKLNAQKNK